MRICMLAYSFYEADNRVMRYAEALVDRGDEVEVIALRQPMQQERDTLHGVTVLRIRERVKNERRKLNYFLRVLMFVIHATFVVGLRHLRRPYKVIHVHSVPDFLVFAACIPKLLGAKVILDVHDLSPELYAIKFKGADQSLAFRLLCLAERASAAFADHVILPNHLWQGRLIARSVSAEKCSVFMNLPDPSIFHRTERVAKNNEKVILLYPGSLQWHQGLDIAIRAFAQLQHVDLRAEFHIYGEGQAKPQLVALAHELKLDDRVIFHGLVPLREIAGVMESADLGIVPKRDDSFGNEAFSTKILEFMALGVPVLVAATAVDRHYFNDAVVSFFKPGSVDDLSCRLRELLESRERRDRQSKAAQSIVEQSFNWSRKKEEYFALVDSLACRAKDMYNEPNLPENANLEMHG